MKLEFGGGESPRNPSYTQIDVRKINDKTIVCNAWDVENHVEKNVVTDIFSRHFFEHLTFVQGVKTLRAWYNICKPGARVVLVCPNMNFHIWQWINWDRLTPTEKRWCRKGIWGGQRDADNSPWDLHKSGYDYPQLKELVEKAGFTGINKLGPDGPEHPHLSVEFFK